MTTEDDCKALREENESLYRELVEKANYIIKLQQELEAVLAIHKLAVSELEEVRGN